MSQLSIPRQFMLGRMNKIGITIIDSGRHHICFTRIRFLMCLTFIVFPLTVYRADAMILASGAPFYLKSDSKD